MICLHLVKVKCNLQITRELETKARISDISLKTPRSYNQQSWNYECCQQVVFGHLGRHARFVLTAVIDLEKVNNPENADNNILLSLMLSLSGTSRSYNYRDCPSPLDSPECWLNCSYSGRHDRRERYSWWTHEHWWTISTACYASGINL